MAEQLIKGASRRYRIDNQWLAENSNNASKYVDILEIKKDPRQSHYIADLIARGVSINYEMEQMRASFWINGFAVGDTSDGENVNCVYLEDDKAYNHTRAFSGAIEHPVRVRRVYAIHTEGKDIEFLGIAKTSSAGL